MAGSPRVPRCPEDKTSRLVFCTRPRSRRRSKLVRSGGSGGKPVCRLATGGSFHFSTTSGGQRPLCSGSQDDPLPSASSLHRIGPDPTCHCDIVRFYPFQSFLSLPQSTEQHRVESAAGGGTRASSLDLPRLIEPTHPKGRAPPRQRGRHHLTPPLAYAASRRDANQAAGSSKFGADARVEFPKKVRNPLSLGDR